MALNHHFDSSWFNDLQNKKDAVQNALSDLDTIIANADTLDLDQARQAIKKLAQFEKGIINFIVRNVTV